MLSLLVWLAFAPPADCQKLDVSHAVDQAVREANGAAVRLQSPGRLRSDRLWDGMLIGGAVGVVVGMFVAPPAFCGRNDGECSAIVRVAIGLPAIGAGIGVGALVDKLHH